MPNSPDPFGALDRLLNDLATRRGVAHAVMAVESGDGSLAWAGAAGRADSDGSPMTPQTPFHVASVTKLYTAAVVLRLHERGALDIEQPMVSYLPEAVTRGLHRHKGSDRTSTITIRQLLDHTSGLASYFEDRPKGEPSLAESLFREGDRAWTTTDMSDRIRQHLRPHFAPGRKIRYCDTNYQLLGDIVEAVSQRTLPEAFAAELLEPLELRNSYLSGHAPPGSPVPASLFFAGEPIDRPLAMRSVGAQGGLVSTVQDGFAFLRALFGGRVFESPDTLALMTSGWRRFGLPLDAAALRAPSWPIEYGLGIMRFQLPRVLNGMRPMPAVLGHTGSSGSWLFHAPEPDLYLAGTVDEVTSGAVPYRLVPKMLRVLTERQAAVEDE
jgi:D-alanyl-D-alanine carboxypeptidase